MDLVFFYTVRLLSLATTFQLSVIRPSSTTQAFS